MSFLQLICCNWQRLIVFMLLRTRAKASPSHRCWFKLEGVFCSRPDSKLVLFLSLPIGQTKECWLKLGSSSTGGRCLILPVKGETTQSPSAPPPPNLSGSLLQPECQPDLLISHPRHSTLGPHLPPSSSSLHTPSCLALCLCPPCRESSTHFPCSNSASCIRSLQIPPWGNPLLLYSPNFSYAPLRYRP